MPIPADGPPSFSSPAAFADGKNHHCMYCASTGFVDCVETVWLLHTGTNFFSEYGYALSAASLALAALYAFMDHAGISAHVIHPGNHFPRAARMASPMFPHSRTRSPSWARGLVPLPRRLGMIQVEKPSRRTSLSRCSRLFTARSSPVRPTSPMAARSPGIGLSR